LALPDNTIELTGASRADIAVRCFADSTITVDNTVVANIYADGNLPADLTVGPYSEGANGTNWSAIRPSYLKDLRFETTNISPDYTESISVGARQLYGKAFDAYTPIFDLLPGVQEWAVSANNHPFHLHVYHQQIQGVCDGGAFEDGEYYDTISGSCDIRFDTNPQTTSAFDGPTIMHCHVLEHEDEGAMGWADAKLGIFDPPTYPDPDTQALLYQQDANGNCVVGPPICVPEPEGPFGDDTCSDLIDNDCDTYTDALDSDCQEDPGVVCSDLNKNACNAESLCEWQGGKKGSCVDAEVCVPDEIGTELTCDDGKDNDCDGLTDTEDVDDCPTPPFDCSAFNFDRKACRAANSCVYDRKTGLCEEPAATASESTGFFRIDLENITKSIKKAAENLWKI
jgi:hypothetical protein